MPLELLNLYSESKAAESEKLADKLTAKFMIDPYVQKWLDGNYVSGKTNQTRLFKAMKIMIQIITLVSLMLRHPSMT